jgi:hypothetical protein
VRRVIVLIVVALVGAAFAGQLIGAKAISVNGTGLSDSTVRAELAAIHATPSYGCYVNALLSIHTASTNAQFNTASTDAQFNVAGAASWTRIQIEGLNVLGYVERHYHWHATAAELKLARSEYVNDLTAGSTATGAKCATSASVALKQLPAWFLNDQLIQNAASEIYVSHLASAVPLTESGLTTYFNDHPSYYDTICVSIAVVPVASAPAFAQAQANGESVSALARKYSADPSAKKGGADGCYSPTSSAYEDVRADTTGTALNTFPAQGLEESSSTGSEYVLYVAPTKLTRNSFAAAAQMVLADAQNYNEQLASLGQSQLLLHASVFVEPGLGTWEPAKGIVVPAKRPAKFVTPNSGAGLVL